MAARQGLSLRISRRDTRARSAAGRAHTLAGHSARLDRRLDLSALEWPPASERPRQQATQAVSVPPSLARGSGRDQVRPDDRVRAIAVKRPAAPAERPRSAGPATREGPRHRRGAAGGHPHPRGQRGVCAGQSLLRTHDTAQLARGRDRLQARVPLPRQGREGARRRRSRPSAQPGRQALPGPSRLRASSSISTRPASGAPSSPPT